MPLFHNVPLKRKLTLISMVTSCVALLLTGGVVVVYELMNARRALVEELWVTARMVADNSAAALTFADPDSAAQTLRSLSADGHVVGAVIYEVQGHPFSTYRATGAPPFVPPPVQRNLHRFDHDVLEVFCDISIAGETIGTVFLRHDLVELRETLRRAVYLILGVMAAASLVAYFLSRKLQPLVAGPIIGLGRVVRNVAIHKDFSVRAVKQGEDEVGRLIDGFNEMLGQIQQRDSALQKAQEDLEKRVTERTAELARSLSLLNATLDSTADGILAVQLSGHVTCFNSQFVSMWGVPPDVLETRQGAEIRQFLVSQVRHPERYQTRIEEMRATPESESTEVIELRDGRTFERYVKPQHEDGRIVGVVVNFRDVTVRRRAEAELENVHQQLLETSRHAGMAEVATGVLHNVGNVLNSVNVSATLVAEGLKKSKAGNLGRVAALLDQHSANLAAFVTDDAQGRNLPDFLRQLHERLGVEQRGALAEVESLRQNIEHIKEIVAMQQEYAQVAGVQEVLKVTDLVEDSLRLNAAALTRHHVGVERDYQAVPLVSIQKHKALQILVNVIRNAKYACDDGSTVEKRIVVRVSHANGRIKISVIDNGVGIPSVNLLRIFNHGFTTRKDGHGFGLHSAALAAAELGGTLRAQSDGPGRGATFTLDLPAADCPV